MDIIKFENFKTTSNKVPEGWVNVKIDRQLEFRLKNYVDVLDDHLISTNKMHSSQKHDLFLKIDALADMNNELISDQVSIQTKLSIVTLLQYFRELKNNFNASTSGFLLEFFLASLIGADVKGDFSKFDFTHKVLNVGNKLKYQIKFYGQGNATEIDWPEDIRKRCDYYVIAIKDGDKIIVSIFNGKNEADPSYMEKFAKPIGRSKIERKEKKVIREKRDKPTPAEIRRGEPGRLLKRWIVMDPKEFKIYGRERVIDNFDYERVIDLDNIERIISSCSQSIQDSIKILFDRISEMEYHAESIITGRNLNSVELSKKKTEEITSDIKNQLDGLSDSLNN
jgi:hypothetical protein